jgi:hypothetical protein
MEGAQPRKVFMNTKELAKTVRLCLLAIALAACAGNLRPVSVVKATATEIPAAMAEQMSATQFVASAAY